MADVEVRSLVGPAPSRLRVGSDHGVSYELAEDVVAAHDADPSSGAVMSLEGDRISVEPIDAVGPREVREGMFGPVYRQMPGGEFAVPTGRVFVRFDERDSATRHEKELGAAGYRIEQVPSYAPHAAWLRPASGSVADALRRLGGVEKLASVEHVEPQLLTTPAVRP